MPAKRLRRQPRSAPKNKLASGDSATKIEIVGGAGEALQRAAQDGTVASSPPRDRHHAHGPDDEAVQEGGQKSQSIEIETSEGSVTPHATPEAPATSATLNLAVATVTASQERRPGPGRELAVTEGDRTVLASGLENKRATEASALARLERLVSELTEVDTIADAKGLRDMAVAIEVFGRQAVLSREVVLKAAETRLLAEQAVGKKLQAMEKPEGGRPANNPSSYTMGLQTLRELGIKPDQSSKWQKIADLPDETLAWYFEEARLSGRPVTTSGAVRLATEREPRDTRLASAEGVQRGRVPRSTAAASSGTVPTAREDLEDRARRQVAPAGPRERDGAHDKERCQDVLGVGCANDSQPSESNAPVDATGDSAGPSASATGEGLVTTLEVRGRLSTAAPAPNRVVRDLIEELRDLGERAFKLNGADLKEFAAGVRGLAAALAERIEGDRETDSRSSRKADAVPGSALLLNQPADSVIANDAGKSWKEVE